MYLGLIFAQAPELLAGLSAGSVFIVLSAFAFIWRRTAATVSIGLVTIALTLGLMAQLIDLSDLALGAVGRQFQIGPFAAIAGAVLVILAKQD